MKPIRVFLVDDSAVSRTAIKALVEGDGRAEIVGEAVDGRQALEKIPLAEPDIVLMDVVMSGMNGIETTRALMQTFPTPVLVVSDLVGRDADLNFRALEAGALDLIRKPSALEMRDSAAVDRLRRRIRLLADVPVITRRTRLSKTTLGKRTGAAPAGSRPKRVSRVCIGASTGGPPALQKVLSSLDGPPPWPILLVQHMSVGFTGGLVKWLGQTTGLEVVMAQDRERIVPGMVYVAGESQHLEIIRNRVVLSSTPPHGGHRPSVDALFDSVANDDVEETVAILMSGMGADGARGLERIRRGGGWTIAQDERSSVVYGMPKAAVDLEAACEVLSVDEISARIAQWATDARTETTK